MSNSLPRTMRRNAAMSGSTSSKANSKVFGLTVPSLSARLLPWVRGAAFSFTYLLRRVLECLLRRQHHRSRAHLVMFGIDAGRRDALLHQRFGRAQQPMPRHDDAVIGGDEVLLGAVTDRPHALLQRRILDGEAGDPAEGLAGLLRGPIDQIVVVLVGERPIG